MLLTERGHKTGDKMNALLGALIALFSLHAVACPFAGKSLNQIKESEEFELKGSRTVNFPVALFSAYPQFEAMTPLNCGTAITSEWLVEKATGKTYRTYRSSRDECDGGNTVGLIVEGRKALPEMAKAEIQDGSLSCLTAASELEIRESDTQKAKNIALGKTRKLYENLKQAAGRTSGLSSADESCWVESAAHGKLKCSITQYREGSDAEIGIVVDWDVKRNRSTQYLNIKVLYISSSMM